MFYGVMARVRTFFLVFTWFIALPAAAQNSDVFREGAPPASAPAVNAVRPHPVPRSQPEYPAIAPPPDQPPVASAPALPPAAQLWARVRLAAQSASVAVPLASNPPFDEVATPPQYRALLGAWGPAAWQGSPAGDRLILVIQSVDAQGNVRGIVATSDGGDSWSNFTAPIASNGFTVHFQRGYYREGFTPGMAILADNYWQIEPRAGGVLSGSRDGGASTIVLPRLQ
jgi:hypothetical protein